MAGFGLVRRSPGLAGLLAAQTISPLGDAMATTALILHVQRATGSATAVGLLLFAQAIPPLAAPLAGVIADRFSPGRLLSIGWLAQAVLAGLVALLLPKRDATPPFVEHLGGGAGFFNVMRIYPTLNVGVVVMGNATKYNLDAAAGLALQYGR